MTMIENPFRGAGMPGLDDVPWPSTDLKAARLLFTLLPQAAETPLVPLPELAARQGVAQIYVKDERGRMGLGSFKALGAAYVIAHDHQAGRAAGRTYVTASAGNHGLSVAMGARAFGAEAVVYIAETVPEAFKARLEAQGAQVVRAGAEYEASMAAAAAAAQANGWDLLSDSSWPGYMERPHRLMEGYLALMGEVFTQMPCPTHIFLQAGVGGLAGAAAAAARAHWGDAPHITVVEPDAAPALYGSVLAGHPVATPGPVSAMGRLDCKEPSLIALRGLARDADAFLTITEDQGHQGADTAAAFDLPTTPSGAAGLAGLLTQDLPPDATALVILSEGPE